MQIFNILPLPKRDTANMLIHVPVSNVGSAPEKGTLQANFEGGVGLTKSLTVSPGESTIVLIPEEFPQLNVAKPRL